MIQFQLKEEHIAALLKGKKLCFNNEVEILPPQDGLFITRKEFDDILANETQIVNKLLTLMGCKERESIGVE